MKTENGHWYGTDGEPHHWVPKKDGSGNRATTLKDAKVNNWLPSVTTVLKSLAKPQLERWIMVQAATAVLTSPRREGEDLDAFMDRVLFKDEEHKQEAAIAAEKGIAIHKALQDYFLGNDVPEDMRPWVMPAAEAIATRGEMVCSEKILVGQGYAGRTDLILEAGDAFEILDFKSTRKLPEKGSWLENRWQLSAYACAFESLMGHDTQRTVIKPIRTANVYVSTVEPGKFIICDNPPWQSDYENGFAPLVKLWSYVNGYTPKQ